MGPPWGPLSFTTAFCSVFHVARCSDGLLRETTSHVFLRPISEDIWRRWRQSDASCRIERVCYHAWNLAVHLCKHPSYKNGTVGVSYVEFSDKSFYSFPAKLMSSCWKLLVLYSTAKNSTTPHRWVEEWASAVYVEKVVWTRTLRYAVDFRK